MEKQLLPDEQLSTQGENFEQPRRPIEPGVDGKSKVRSFSARIRWFEWILSSSARRVGRLLYPVLFFARRLVSARGVPPRVYRSWIKKYDVISPQLRTLMANEIAAWPSRPIISVIMPSFNTDPKWMTQTIESVCNQIYPHWELCISDDASTIDGIRPLVEQYAAQELRIHTRFRSETGHISVNSNAALDLAHGDYVALVGAGDCLSEDALFWVAREIAMHPDVDLLFSDQDKIDCRGKRSDPQFKSAWNQALMHSQDAFSHFGIYRRRIIEQVGRFREGFEGSQGYDLVLRCAEMTTGDRIRHIPRVLYHCRVPSNSIAANTDAAPYAWRAAARAIEEHLARTGIAGKVSPVPGGYYQVNYPSTLEPPKVSILMPSACRLDVLRPCMAALLERSTYLNFEVLLSVNVIRYRDSSQAAYLRELERDGRVRVLVYQDREFNLAWTINWAADQAEGPLFCLMNDDVEVITKDWLERLVARVALDGVGAAGPMLYYPSGAIQHAGVVLGVGGVADHAFKGRRRGYSGPFGRARLEQDYSCLTGACLLVKRAIFEEVGGFDEALPIAFNDVDFCIKVRRAGARIVWTPSVEMYHHESVTLGKHDAGERRSQFLHDVELMRDRWQDILANDPCYNPNLSLVHGSMFTLAWPPRVPDPKEVVTALTRTSISRTSNLAPRNRQAPSRAK